MKRFISPTVVQLLLIVLGSVLGQSAEETGSGNDIPKIAQHLTSTSTTTTIESERPGPGGFNPSRRPRPPRTPRPTFGDIDEDDYEDGTRPDESQPAETDEEILNWLYLKIFGGVGGGAVFFILAAITYISKKRGCCKHGCCNCCNCVCHE